MNTNDRDANRHSAETSPRSWARREALGLVGALGGAAALSHAMTGPAQAFPMSREIDFGTPKEQLDLYVKLTGSLDEEDVPWWYFGVIVGLTPEGGSQTLFRFEGMEILRYYHRGDAYQQTGRTLTFLRDIETGAFLEEWKNPYTGEMNAIEPNILGGGPGMMWMPNKVAWTGMEAQFPEEPFKLKAIQHQDEIWVYKDRVYPPMAPPILSESSFSGTKLDHLLDPEVRRCEARFSSTFIAPWWSWMNMGDQYGALIWQAQGWKLGGIDELPDAYRERAQSLYPEQLSADYL